MATRRSEMLGIEAKLSAYICEVCLPTNSKAGPGYDENLFEAGIVDSAGLISFVCFIEKEFELTIPDEDLLPDNFVSIRSIADYIRSRPQMHNDRS